MERKRDGTTAPAHRINFLKKEVLWFYSKEQQRHLSQLFISFSQIFPLKRK